MPVRLSPGATLADRYTIERMLDEDGFEVFYAAHDARFDEPVVVEVLGPKANDTFIPDTYPEVIRTLRRSRCASFVPISDYFTGDDRTLYTVWHVSEWRTLEMELAARPTGLPLSLVISAAHALADLHAQGLVHVDVKPRSFVLDGEDVRLARFAMSRRIGALSRSTAGTLPYMARETADTEIPIAPTRDVFAFGIMAVQLLTGEIPFVDDDEDAWNMLARRQREDQRVRALGLDLPDALVDVLDRAAAPAPLDRYADGAALAEALVSASTLMETPLEPYAGTAPYVFISYAHKDQHAARRTMTALAKAGVRIWFDQGITGGMEWAATIEERLSSCAVFCVLLSPSAVASRNVRDEIGFALDAHKSFLGVFLEETELGHGLKLRLSRIQMSRAWTDDYVAAMHALLADVQPALEPRRFT